MRQRTAIEALLASIAVSSVAAFAGCTGGTGGTEDPNTSTSSSGSSGASSNGSIGTSSGTSSSGASSGTGTCANGKDPICGCTRPDTEVRTYAYQGPPDGGVTDSGVSSDGGPWRCEEECQGYHFQGNESLTTCSFIPTTNPTQVSCTFYLQCVGRRPAEHVAASLASPAARDILTEIATLEAASVHAFVRLARELAHHRAPSDLVARVREAAEDERRHARSMRALAIRFGATDVPKPRRGARRAPRLVDVLVENAVEGCVRETFGALMAHVQARHATDPVARRTMETIAIDESRHAALAWAIDAWGRERLAPAEQQRVDAARQEAVRLLRDEIAAGPAEVDEAGIGLVGARHAGALADALATELWAAAA